MDRSRKQEDESGIFRQLEAFREDVKRRWGNRILCSRVRLIFENQGSRQP
jgi:hypothetical protein